MQPGFTDWLYEQSTRVDNIGVAARALQSFGDDLGQWSPGARSGYIEARNEFENADRSESTSCQ